MNRVRKQLDKKWMKLMNVQDMKKMQEQGIISGMENGCKVDENGARARNEQWIKEWGQNGMISQ